MKRIILVYGIISGVITSTLMLITMPMFKSGALDLKNGALIGYTGMVIALSFIFFGIKSYRDNQVGGNITFWKGCQIGILIALIASVCYALTWEYTFRNLGTEFLDKMMGGHYQEMKDSGAPEAEIKELETMMVAYKESAVMRFFWSLIEIFPIGLVITLVCAAILRNKNFLPGTPQTSTAD
jgi:Protein of unknown function (DUF4199)